MHRALSGLALALIPASIWSLTHTYHGLGGDAGLYALQALARLDTSLGRDVFLIHASQDRYTIFSPLYAFFISWLGLRAAGLVLLIAFKTCFLAATWAFCRKLFDPRLALLAVTLLIVADRDYGAYQVFHYSEDMLTARSLAEALAVIALSLHAYEHRIAGLVIAVLAVAVHPLMALPMVLLLICVRFPFRASAWCALAAVLMAFCISVSAVLASRVGVKWLAVMDPIWLDMVRERSQFCFLQLWRSKDWAVNARPFLSLTMSLFVLRDIRIQKVITSAMLVGTAGLLIGLIAGWVGPVALLLQGQAWRWDWITALVSVLVLAPTVTRLWKAERCGPLCALLLAAGWLFSARTGICFLTVAAAIWLSRRWLEARWSPYLPWMTAAAGIAITACGAMGSWKGFSLPAETGGNSRALGLARAFLAMDGVPILLTALLGHWIATARSIGVSIVMVLGVGTATALAVPTAINIAGLYGSEALFEEFSDWRKVIPPGSNVLDLQSYYSAAFEWFTLERPSYLTVDQSSGVIFSRATAMDVLHRSTVLLPVEEPDWRLLSRQSGVHHGEFDARALPLTRERLMRICADPELGFVMAREDIGFAAIRHTRTANGWTSNLYDCSRVRSLNGQ